MVNTEIRLIIFFAAKYGEALCCCCCRRQVASVVSDSVRPHRRQPTRLCHPWDSPGKNTGVSCHFLENLIQSAKTRLGADCGSDHELLIAKFRLKLKKVGKITRPFSHFSSVTQSCPTLCDPMNRSMPGLPIHHQLPEFTQTHVHQVSDAIQPSHPLLSPSPPAPNPSQHQGLFQ